MGSWLGGQKLGAIKLGISLEEYQGNLAGGLLWCTGCKQWLPKETFHKNRARNSGYSSHCKACAARLGGYDKRSFQGKYEGRPGTLERREKAAEGLYWCRRCENWLPEKEIVFRCDGVSEGVCREHRRLETRERYAKSEKMQAKARAWSKKRREECKPIRAIERRRLLSIFNGMCAYCEEREFEEWDHVLAQINGGDSAPGNVVPACRRCNRSKLSYDVYEWMEKKGLEPSEKFLEVINTDIVDIDYTHWRRPGRPGERNPRAKLTDEQAKEIRRRYSGDPRDYKVLAEEYGVHKATISRIVRGITYNG